MKDKNFNFDADPKFDIDIKFIKRALKAKQKYFNKLKKEFPDGISVSFSDGTTGKIDLDNQV